ncbi:transposase, partial [Staphylococcus aureus]|nr:transposase [Staphylococcus aureus]
IGMYDDLANDDKTFGEALSHNGMTLAAGSAGTAVGAGLATFVLGSNPVGWVILAGLAMSTVFALGTDLIYQNNIFGLKDKVDWVGHKIDNSIDVVKKTTEKS